MVPETKNIDIETVEGFGDEWTRFDQSELPDEERSQIFADYFDIFPWSSLPAEPRGFDLGCGSGRWALLVSERVGHLACIDASKDALDVATRNLSARKNVSLHQASVDQIPLEDNSQDFGYSLGVLHHVPDTAEAIRRCVQKLRPGAPFLVYLYYAFDNRPRWFRNIWRATDAIRYVIARTPEQQRQQITDMIAAGVYFPLARASGALETLGIDVASIPLSYYRDTSFYTMRTDARDRFGTRLEQRFTKGEIATMLNDAGLTDLRFSDKAPYWCAVGIKTQ